MTLDANTRLARSDAAVATESEDGVAILDLDGAQYINLNRVGARIWMLLESEIPFGELCDRLGAGYDVDRDTCARQAGAFIAQMQTLGVIRVGGGSQVRAGL